MVAGGVVAGTQSSDEAALQPARHGGSQDVERRVDRLLRKMTLQEKLDQIQLISDGQINEKPEEATKVGGVFSLVDPVLINKYQRMAVEESRLGIPILFAYDTIHGFRTIFPIPLGAASSFDPKVASQDHKFGARESAAVGLKQIYSPMVDVSHEPRWGRISEAGGEDPYLNSVFAAARVKAAQGRDYSKPDKVVTSVKHYAAYGQPEGGRDYGTTDMSVRRLHDLYLPPFKAAIDAGSDTAMCSFNSISGTPGCAHKELETDLLKGKWGFDGFIESDYTAVSELINHGIAGDGAEAAAAALNAGTDSEMVSQHIRDNGEELLAEGKISQRRIDDAVRRILRVKFRAGLFENPYVDVSKAESAQLRPDAVAAAREAAGRSMVLLKNDGGALPMSKTKKTAVIGPLGDDGHAMLGPWWGRGDPRTRSASTRASRRRTRTRRSPRPASWPTPSRRPTRRPTSAARTRASAPRRRPRRAPTRSCSPSASRASRAVRPPRAARSTCRVGRRSWCAGSRPRRAASRSRSCCSTAARSRSRAWSTTRPRSSRRGSPASRPANAVADVVFGAVNPGGKLPVSFPRRVGQVPIYYNHEPTGRPCDVTQKYVSRYRDIKSCDPEFEFGYGLSYSRFEISNLRLSRGSVSRNGSVRAMVDVKNVSGPEGDEVVQLYIRDPVASLSQPVRRLRGFERVTLAPGEQRTVTFTLDKSDFGFHDNSGRFIVEPGQIDVYAGNSSKGDLKQSFQVTG